MKRARAVTLTHADADADRISPVPPAYYRDSDHEDSSLPFVQDAVSSSDIYALNPLIGGNHQIRLLRLHAGAHMRSSKPTSSLVTTIIHIHTKRCRTHGVHPAPIPSFESSPTVKLTLSPSHLTSNRPCGICAFATPPGCSG